MTSSSSRPHVGIIGLGLLGQALARRLRGSGFAVVGFDIDAAKMAHLATIGGEPASTVAELAQRCDPIVLAVFDTDQVEEVVERALPAGLARTVICCSTCDPDRIAALAERVAGRGLRFLEAPVSGSSGQVARGEGLGLVGGDKAAADAVETVIAAMFPRWHHIGRCGDGGRAKLAINLVLGLNRLALAEGLVFAQRLGLDASAFLGVARQSAAYSQIMDVKGGKMIAREFAAEGRAAQHLKDVELILAQARRIGQQLPLAAVHADVLAACLRHGEGDLDNCVVIEEIRRRCDKETR